MDLVLWLIAVLLILAAVFVSPIVGIVLLVKAKSRTPYTVWGILSLTAIPFTLVVLGLLVGPVGVSVLA